MLPERWLTVDPGEDTGWALWSGTEFLDHGTEKMWYFGDAVWDAALDYLGSPAALPVEGQNDLEKAFRGITHIVVENWALYPWKLRGGELDWDECRTARLIGSLFQVFRLTGWTYEQQPAQIKERAVAAGAETYFSHPLRENRHANDATMHGVYRIALESKAQWTDLSQTSWLVDSTPTS
jgi:hypothetical protein